MESVVGLEKGEERSREVVAKEGAKNKSSRCCVDSMTIVTMSELFSKDALT